MSFDRLAPIYPAMEAVLAGPRLQRCRTLWLGELRGCQRLLIAGVGHGPAVHLVLAAHPEIHVTCLDASAAMLAQCRRNLQQRGAPLERVTFVHAPLPGWATTDRFDAIATHFFLDCFPPAELRAVIATLAAVATPDARWIVTDFTLPARGPARWRARFIHALMYAFFRVFTRLPARRVTAPDALLGEHGFLLRGRRTQEWGLLQADLWERAP